MHFGKSLYTWRKAKGLTQEDLAVAVAVNVSYISNLERNFSATTKSGKPRPSEDLCARFAKVLGRELDEVRLAAGYAPSDQRAMIEVEGLRFAPHHAEQYTPEELEELKQTIEVSYGIFKKRVEERKKREGE